MNKQQLLPTIAILTLVVPALAQNSTPPTSQVKVEESPAASDNWFEMVPGTKAKVAERPKSEVFLDDDPFLIRPEN